MSYYLDINQYADFNLGANFYTDIELQKFFENKGSTDQLYNQFIVKPLLFFSYQISYKELDRGWLEYIFIKTPSLVCFSLAKILNQNFGSLKINFLPAILYIGFFFSYYFFLILK
jgi:hypothetical protein